MIRSLRNWDKPFDRCISLASVTNVSYVRLSSRRNHRSSRRRERKKSIDRHLTYGHRGNLQESMIRARWPRMKGYCGRLLNVSRGIAYTWRCVARIDIGWRKRRRRPNGTRNSELNKERTKTRLCSSFFAPSFLERNPILIKTSHY